MRVPRRRDHYPWKWYFWVPELGEAPEGGELAVRQRPTGRHVREPSLIPDLSQTERRRRLRQNIVWNYGSGIASVASLVLLYPVAVQLAGTERYGLWVLIFGATQLLGYADFGLADGVVRQLSTLTRADEPTVELRRFVTVAISLFALLGAALVILFTVLVPLYLMTVPTAGFSRSEIVWLVAAGALSLGNVVLTRAVNAVLWALDRQDIERKSNAGGVALRAVGYLGVWAFGGGLPAVVLAEFAGTCVTPLVCGSVVLARVGRLDFARAGFRRFAPGLVRLGASLFVGSMALVVSYQAPLYVVGSNLGLTATTAFGALMRIYQSARLVNSWMANPFIHGIATESGEHLQRATRNALGLTLAVGSFVSVLLVALSQDLMVAWMGAGFAFAASAAAITSIGVVADAIIQPSVLMTNLRGDPRRLAVLNLLNLTALLIATSVAVRHGTLLAVMGTATLTPALLTPLYLREARRSVGVSPWRGLSRTGLSVGVAMLLLGLVAWLIGRALAPWPAMLTMGATVIALGCGGALFWRRRRAVP